MSAGWVAAGVRARLLCGHRLGEEGAREIAAARSVRDAVARLARSEYGRRRPLEGGLAAAERDVSETVLLRLRLLAAWVPPGEVELLRVLAAWFELANVEDRLAYVAGGEPPHPFQLGSLGAVWSRASAAQSAEELRHQLAASAWGDPGSVEPAVVHRYLRLAWARRLLDAAPETTDWVAGALALLVARELVLDGHPPELPERVRPLLLVLGAGWEHARTLPQLAVALPLRAAWPLEGLQEGEELWRGEVRWWLRVEREAEEMMHAGRADRSVVVGAAALLAADARRVLAALEAVARNAHAELEEALGAGA
jgi:hypothetical protein